jgi:hypothetical protein
LRKAITSLLILVALVGCTPGEPTRPTVVEPTPASPSPTVERATAKQYGQLVGPLITRIRAAWKKFEDNDCATAGTLPCRLYASTLEMETQTLFIALKEEPLGAPPAELQELVSDTIDAAEAVDKNIDTEGNPDPLQLPIAMGDLAGVFDRWEPYL